MSRCSRPHAILGPRRQRIRAERVNGVIVAGVEREHLDAVVEGLGVTALQFSAQGFDLRRQAGLRLAFGPHQLVAKVGQARVLALFPDQQFVAQLVLPALEFAPDVAVAQAQSAACAAGDGPLAADGLQQVDQGVAHQCRAAVARQGVVEL